ncbi:MAG: hypothetical protein AB1714_30075 [Acidobacteriota bacterium]
MIGLSADELVQLIRRVFAPRPDDHQLAILVDLPDAAVPDTATWRERREMASEWARLLAERAPDLGLGAVNLVLYRNVRANNADLPSSAVVHAPDRLPLAADELTGDETTFERVFATHQLLIAPTEFSATAPLKVAARVHRFRAATMPGFTAQMVPALKLNYEAIAARVCVLKTLLDESARADLTFRTPAGSAFLTIDLRHRTAHESTGLLHEPGTAGNLPSGEAYIVPYEGEIPGDPSRTAGELPVQFGDEVVVYRVIDNTAVEVLSRGAASSTEAERLASEPAYGNIAELGLGVLAEFGVKPAGEILLDEKLGLHIAFGRSDHFGGQVGPSKFSSPDRVVHVDRVYIDSIQPLVRLASVDLGMPSGAALQLIRDGKYAICFED